jgi:exopolysaccharide biosynthesis polyprenyl glycosylphosphotransferase
MLRRHRQIRTQIHQLMDAALFAVSFWLAYVLRSNPHITQWFKLPAIGEFESFVWLYLVLIPAAPLILEIQGFYSRPLLCPRWATLWPLFKGCLFTTILMTIILYFFKLYLARTVVIWFGGISFILVFLKEELLRFTFKTRLARIQYRKRFVLVGTPEETRRMRAELETKSQEEIEILAELDLGRLSIERLVETLHEHSVNGVILSAKHAYFEQLEAAIRACEVEGVEAWLVADFFKTQISRTSFDDFYGRPVMVFRTTPDASWQGVLKQVLDFVGALLVLLILSIPFLIVSLAIKLTSRGPVLFRQQRAGLNGRPFTMYKFRTMVTNAEQLKAELAALNEMSGPVFKLTNDPRVTRVGRWLRKFSLDEFPQLFNVLRGEMSLVGPRPQPVDEVRRFDDLAHRRRLSVKPGLTCLWQVSGRNNVSDFKDWVRLDLEYIDNWSLWLDLKILWRTVPVVLAGTGAR